MLSKQGSEVSSLKKNEPILPSYTSLVPRPPRPMYEDGLEQLLQILGQASFPLKKDVHCNEHPF